MVVYCTGRPTKCTQYCKSPCGRLLSDFDFLDYQEIITNERKCPECEVSLIEDPVSWCVFLGDTVGPTSLKKYACPPTQLVPPAYIILHVKYACPPRRNSHLNAAGPPNRPSPLIPQHVQPRKASPTPNSVRLTQHVPNRSDSHPIVKRFNPKRLAPFFWWISYKMTHFSPCSTSVGCSVKE